MTQSVCLQVETVTLRDIKLQEKFVRRFARQVSVILMILCNVIVLAVVWASGINLDELVARPDVFNSDQDICLRFRWQAVTGVAQPVGLCSEWLNLSDPSGKTHEILREGLVRQGPDGLYYAEQGIYADFRLLGLLALVVMVIVVGLLMKWALVSRYRRRLESAASKEVVLVY